MTNTVYCAVSLDGFIADTNHGVEFLESAGPGEEGEDFGWADFFNPIDAIVMGRNTYDVFLGFGMWPYDDKKIIVLSNRDITIPDDYKDKVSAFAGFPDQIVEHAKSLGHDNLYIDGGIVVQQFLSAGLVDKIVITIIPILIGEGISLFGPLNENIKLETVKADKFDNGIVQLHYDVIK